jgi:hypothetical protein
MKKIKLEVVMLVTVEIDEANDIVQDYNSDKELLSDIVSYRFSSTLPVMQSGVKAEFEDTSFEILKTITEQEDERDPCDYSYGSGRYK